MDRPLRWRGAGCRGPSNEISSSDTRYYAEGRSWTLFCKMLSIQIRSICFIFQPRSLKTKQKNGSTPKMREVQGAEGPRMKSAARILVLCRRPQLDSAVQDVIYNIQIRSTISVSFFSDAWLRSHELKKQKKTKKLQKQPKKNEKWNKTPTLYFATMTTL